MLKTPKITRFESTLISVLDMSDSVKEFTFSTQKEFTFLPGQFATILFEKDGKKYRRPYSIASTPSRSEQTKLCIKYVENGPGSTYLWSLKVGDKVNMMAPLGVFVVKDEHKTGPLVFISTGTGIGPFISIISDLLENDYQHNITLICGFRHDALYYELLTTLAKNHNNFNYKPILSQPKTPNKEIAVGRIHTHLTPELFNVKNAHYYICGLYQMIEQTCRTLVDNGVKREHIHFERYD